MVTWKSAKTTGSSDYVSFPTSRKVCEVWRIRANLSTKTQQMRARTAATTWRRSGRRCGLRPTQIHRREPPHRVEEACDERSSPHDVTSSCARARKDQSATRGRTSPDRKISLATSPKQVCDSRRRSSVDSEFTPGFAEESARPTALSCSRIARSWDLVCSGVLVVELDSCRAIQLPLRPGSRWHDAARSRTA
jgi:hypothetical protein